MSNTPVAPEPMAEVEIYEGVSVEAVSGEPTLSEEPEEVVEKSVIETLIDKHYAEYLLMESRPKHSSLNMTLHSTHVDVLVNGYTKSIALNEFKDLLDSMMAFSERKMQNFQLPYGCFSFAADSSNIQLQTYYPEATKDLKYSNGDREATYTVPFPNVIITHSLQKIKGMWRVQFTRYYCTEKTVPQLGETFISHADPENGIYLIPISNTYSEGNMCFGKNSMPITFNDNLRGLDYYYQFLFISPFNSDLGIKALRTDGVIEWFKKWSTLKAPPYNFLKARKY